MQYNCAVVLAVDSHDLGVTFVHISPRVAAVASISEFFLAFVFDYVKEQQHHQQSPDHLIYPKVCTECRSAFLL